MQLELTDDAQKTIIAMRDHLANVRYQLGETNKDYCKMAASLAFSLAQMLNLGGRVMKDGELSLICQNDYLTYGVNFTASKFRDREFPESLLGEWSVNS